MNSKLIDNNTIFYFYILLNSCCKIFMTFFCLFALSSCKFHSKLQSKLNLKILMKTDSNVFHNYEMYHCNNIFSEMT